MQQQRQSDDVIVCPSFNSYSANGLAAIAAKVRDEFDDEERTLESLEEDDDFEFSFVLGDETVTADEVVYDGPIFPIFNRDLSKNDGKDGEIRRDEDVSSIRIPLKKLFIDDREERASTSSSEADELEPIPAGAYCVWKPNFVESSPNRWKKSPSTGSGSGSGSKRWKLRDLLRRSNSDGKGPFVFLTPKHREDKTDAPKQRRNSSDGVRKVKAAGGVSASPSRSSPHEVFYIRNRAEKEEGKRKSYLPYRRDLVGFFASVHGMEKPF